MPAFPGLNKPTAIQRRLEEWRIMMTYESITVEPVSPHIGAEIGNIDLTKPLPNKQVEELHQAFIQHQVIFFRDQKISFEDQIRLGRYFGPLGSHVGKSTISKTTDNPYVRKFHYDETSTQISGENFHM
jgi:taurine dioxygenase